jgi:hypothetical protein
VEKVLALGRGETVATEECIVGEGDDRSLGAVGLVLEAGSDALHGFDVGTSACGVLERVNQWIDHVGVHPM